MQNHLLIFHVPGYVYKLIYHQWLKWKMSGTTWIMSPLQKLQLPNNVPGMRIMMKYVFLVIHVHLLNFGQNIKQKLHYGYYTVTCWVFFKVTHYM